MKFISAERIGNVPVYDLSIDHEDHSFLLDCGLVAHNCAYVIANRPIQNFIPLTTIGDTRCTQYTAVEVESVGGIKVDLLAINQLNDISKCLSLVQSRSGKEIPESLQINGRKVPGHRLVVKDDQFYDIWDLPEDPSVFEMISKGKTETVFQFNTASALQWLKTFDRSRQDGTPLISSVRDMAIFTALDRPGPLDLMLTNPDDDTMHNALVEYARRAQGLSRSKDVPEVFDDLLPETQGLLIFQENLQNAYQYLTGCSGAEAEEFRRNVAKKKKEKVDAAYPFFIARAAEKLGSEQAAKDVWQGFGTWSSYGFCFSHALAYSKIAYGCAYLKHYFTLEWWTAVLCNAEKNEINEKFWKHCGNLIDLPDIRYSGQEFEIQNGRIRAPVSLLHGIGETAHDELCKGMPYTDIQDLCNKIQAYKEANSTQILKKKKDKKTGTVTEVPAVKLGSSALKRNVIYSLIISGAMDSLFSETVPVNNQESRPITTLDRLQIFEEALAKATGKKKPQPVDPRYINVGPLVRFQMRKKVLPAYAENILPLLEAASMPGLEKGTGKWDYVYRLGDSQTYYPVVSPIDLQRINELDLLIDPISVAIPVYVEKQENYIIKSLGKPVCKLNVDLQGEKLEFTKWPNKKNVLHETFHKDHTGEVVMLVISKYAARKPWSIFTLETVLNALYTKKEDMDE